MCSYEWRAQRLNVEHAQGDQFWLAARQFPAQISKNKHKKKPLSRKISERKLECSLKSTTTTTINLIIQPRYRLRAQALVQNTNVPKRTRKKRFKYIIYNLNRLGEVVAVKKCSMRVVERFNSGIQRKEMQLQKQKRLPSWLRVPHQKHHPRSNCHDNFW